MKVKICGITNYEDAAQAIDFGADALGFVFYSKSPRFISPSEAKAIINKLPPFVEKVGLFVNESAYNTNKIAKDSNITLAQIHFEAQEEFYKKLSVPYIKVTRAKNPHDIQKYQDEYRIVDAFVESYGGEGKSINLDWFQDIDVSKIILAGGLSDKNLQNVAKYSFYGVDVSSGVEKSKGKKDRMLLRNFIETAKNGKI